MHVPAAPVLVAEAVVVTVLTKAFEAVVVPEAVVVTVLTNTSEAVVVLSLAVVVVTVVEARVVDATESPKLDESWKLVVPQTFGFVA